MSAGPASERAGFWSLGMARVLAAVDLGFMAVALPTIQRDLGVGLAGLQWAAAVYAIAYAALALPGGALGDRIGRRRVFLGGLAVFAAGAVVCSLAQGSAALIAGRAVQGAGAGFLQPATWALLTAIVPAERFQQAVAVRSGTTAAGLAVSPLLGAVLLETLGWRSIFWSALPIVAVAALAALRFVPESRGSDRGPIDWAGAGLIAAATAAVCGGLLDLGHAGGATGWALLAGGLVLAGLFALRMARARRPLIDPAAVGRRPQPVVLTVAFAISLALSGALLLQQVAAQSALGISATAAGALSLPITLLFILGAAASTRLLAWTGLGRLAAAGLAVATIGLAVLATLSPTAGELKLLVGNALIGAGLGVTMPGITAAAISLAPVDARGAVAGALSLVQHLGYAIGIAVFAAVAAAVTTSSWEGSAAGTGEPSKLLSDVVAGDIAAVGKAAGAAAAGAAQDAFLDGSTAACVAGAAIIAATALLALRGLRRSATMAP